MHEEDQTNKALIFTQYNGTIQYLGAKLQAAGFSYRTIHGDMPMKQRAAAINAFQCDPPTTVRARTSPCLAICRMSGLGCAVCSGIFCALV